MSVYNLLPFCDVCGMPYHNGLPTCDCNLGAVILAQEDQDDEAIEEQIRQLNNKLKNIT